MESINLGKINKQDIYCTIDRADSKIKISLDGKFSALFLINSIIERLASLRLFQSNFEDFYLVDTRRTDLQHISTVIVNYDIADESFQAKVELELAQEQSNITIHVFDGDGKIVDNATGHVSFLLNTILDVHSGFFDYTEEI